MKCYASTTLMWGKTIDEISLKAKSLGLAGIEIWAEQAWYYKMTDRDIRRALKQHQLDATFHAASWDLNLCSLNAGIRKQSIEEIIRSIDFAASIGTKNITVHPGKRTLTNDWNSWHFDCLQHSLDTLEEVAKTYGVILSVELMEPVKKEFVTSPTMLNQIVAGRSSSIQTTFDVAHVSFNKDLITTHQEVDRMNKIHLSDTSASQYHVALGQGILKLIPYIEFIQSSKLPIILEGYDTSEEADLLRKHLQYLNECNEKTEDKTIEVSSY
ncbi:sugar phosphate isomerase/epimerase family protein [Alkalihalobacterium chitinilyticum]|uniref:Sugar phosphate isomerase/epimerase n=1 Tax=Alkalihalobacterium chitinilyticum TaxID=2980103 RepID=A0ABT5VEV4_9BACI|nr:sugar phosphate isomerase/epimerase family protein [Alkalihalobacterium chitinilyticum]MDE5413993.1 sugar phosphate isomerase/epimerase [Alkalihalobacterium chitinilyticum]